MKKAWLLGCLFLGMVGCDYIDQPRKTIEVPTDPVDSTDQKVVIEDFTGHLCKNCPKATKTAKEVEAAFPGRVHTLAIYSKIGNSFNNINADYPTDFTNDDSDAIFDYFNKTYSMPLGMVNRKDYSINLTHLKAYGSWPQEAAPFVTLKTPLQIVIVPSYNASNRLSTLTVRTHAIQTVAGPLKIAAFILEDGVVSPQLQPDDTRDPNYVHNHILRVSYNSAFGEELTGADYPSGQNIVKTFSKTVDPAWVEGNCTALVMVYNDNTKQIIQSEVVSLIP